MCRETDTRSSALNYNFQSEDNDRLDVQSCSSRGPYIELQSCLGEPELPVRPLVGQCWEQRAITEFREGEVEDPMEPILAVELPEVMK